jgi:hypothetical protein
MRTLPVLALSALSMAATAGCTRTPAATLRTALDCPVSAGKLTRASVSPDGRTCRYADSLGDDLELRLVAVNGGPEAVLAPIAQSLQAQAESLPKLGPKASAKGRGDARDADDDAEDDGDAGANMAAGDHANIDLPGLHVNASGGSAEVQVGGVHVDASGGRAVVQSAREAKMRGNPFVLERRGYRATYMLSRDDLPGGYALLGYEAGGPKTGPLTVAVVRARGHSNGVFAQAKRLVRLNGGV